jgi:hypothetical protein
MAASPLRLGGWRSVGALVAVGAVLTGIGQTRAGHSLLEKAGLIQRPTPYTALSFTSARQPLQSKAQHGRRVRYTLTFAIQNAEPRPQDYRWSVLLAQPGSRARVISTSTQRVVPGNKATIPFRKTISCRPGSVEFIVQLADPSEAIHAWGSCPGHRR